MKEGTVEANKLLKGFTSEELQSLDTHLLSRKFYANEYITREEEAGDFIYLIESGEVEVLRNATPVNKMGPGDSFGLMSFLDDSKRSASVKSVGTTVTKVLPFHVLSAFSSIPRYLSIFQKIMKNHMLQQQTLVRKMDDKVIDEMKNKLQEADLRISFGRLFLTVVLGLVGYLYLLDLTARGNIESGIMLNSIMILILGAMGYFYIRKSPFPKAMFGLTLKNWKPAVAEAMIGSLGLIGLGIGLKWLYVNIVPSYEQDVFLSVDAFYEVGWKKSTLYIMTYALFVPCQEILARCAIQGSLQHFLDGKFATAKAILITSVLFSVLHLIVNPIFAYFTLVPSIFWGILFARKPSLLAVSISHLIIGVFFIWFDFFPISDLVHL